jgi:hypothetical protein
VYATPWVIVCGAAASAATAVALLPIEARYWPAYCVVRRPVMAPMCALISGRRYEPTAVSERAWAYTTEMAWVPL